MIKQQLLVEADTVVIPTTSIPKGIAALFQYDPSSSLEDNHSHMTTALESVKSGSVTFAVRDTKIDGVEIKKANSWDCQKAKLLQAMMMNLLPSLVCLNLCLMKIGNFNYHCW